MVEVDTAQTRAMILELKIKIDDYAQELHDKIERIRDDAKNYERDAVNRYYAETEPMRRQMEAMIHALSDYESLSAPSPVVFVTTRET